MIQIYIDNRLIDLDKTNISLQKEFEDVVENIPTEIEYSYTISIPATMNNREIFGFTDVFDVADKFKRLYNADLYVDEQLILTGKFKVTSIEGGYYKGNLYNPKKKTVSEILGDRNLNEIIPHYKPMNDLGDYDKINNEVCGIEIEPNRLPTYWNCASAQTIGYSCEQITDVHDNHVVFPYVLYGLPMNNPEEVSVDMDIYTQELQYKKHNISEDRIYPAFNVISVLKDIFKTEGYELTGNIIDGSLKDYFNGLYQTFQYSQDDYVKNKEVPFYCYFSGGYRNYCRRNDYTTYETPYNPSPTLEIMELWDTSEWHWDDGDDVVFDGKFRYGVDNPWSAGGKDMNHTFGWFNNDIDDKKKMLVRGTEDTNTGVIIIPKSGWYKIKFIGNTKYVFKGNEMLTGIERLPVLGIKENGDIIVGGTTDEADCTDLSQQPLEIQIKKGTPKQNPRFYSFFSFVPGNAVEYVEDKTVAMEEYGGTYLKIPEGESQRRYPKNGGAAYVKAIGDYNDGDFICGARLGGAWQSSQWGPAGHGAEQRWNRPFGQAVGLALPRTNSTTFKYYHDEPLEDPYKAGDETKYDGTFFQLCDANTNKTYEYAEDTALCLVRKDDAYTNFSGYNTMVETNLPGGGYIWDTTSNYGAVSWVGAESCSASTSDKYTGQFNINTVVWLDEGDTLYMEVLMPYHTAGTYRHSTGFRASKWENRHEWVNATLVDYSMYIGFLKGDKDWKPKVGDGILSFDDMKKPKLTNVNQFLPQTKCNDYLEKFLKTFNLQLTMRDAKTFSIDSISNTNMMGNIIDIDKKCNIDDAEFKPIKSESIKEYKWKIDNSETGYVQGNKSPHMSGHGESVSGSAYYESGYTGEQILQNDANSSGSSKKIEAPWSYNWYKTIHFLHNYYPQPFTEEYADISVISDSDIWKDGMTFAIVGNEKPKTTKTMRLFTLKKNQEQDDKMFSYISFQYDVEKIREQGGTGGRVTENELVCNLVLPSNYYETIDIDGNIHRLHLDYTIMGNSFDGRAYNQSLMDVFFDKNVQAGYDIEIPIKLSNEEYAATKQGTLFKLHDGLYKVKSIEGHDIEKKSDATLTLTTLK